MKTTEMTGADFMALMEEQGFPDARDTILTSPGKFKSDSADTPLSGIDGSGGDTTEPYELDKQPEDAPSTPAVQSMEEPSRIVKMDGGKKSKTTKSTADSDAGSDDADNSDEKNEDDEMTNAKKGFTVEDFDLEGVIEGIDNPDAMYMEMEMGGDVLEHDMAKGEIAVTQDFMIKLICAANEANLDEEKISMVVDCVAECCEEDRTLDVGDLGKIMEMLKDKAGAGDDMDDDMGDDGDMDDDMEGETTLMSSMAAEGDEETRQKRDKKRKKDQNRKSMARKRDDDKADMDECADDDKDDDKDDDGEKLDEAMMAIPMMGQKVKPAPDGLSEEELELHEMKRLAGIV